MLKSTAKANLIALTLKEQLEFRIRSMSNYNQVAQKQDANGWPILTISEDGDEDAGDPAVKIRIAAVDGSSDDIFGNATKAYAPHLMTILFEAGSNNAADLIIICHEAMAHETQAELRQTADGTAIADARLDDGPIVASHGNLFWPTKES
jgi:hypothetical protein